MEGNARRLPSWMVGGMAAAAAADSNANNKEKKSRKVSKGQVEDDAIASGARRRKKGTASQFRGDENGNDYQFDNDGGGGVRTKTKGKSERMQNGVAKKWSAKVGGGWSVSVDCTGEEEEEDVELTVENLVSIAEEYVKADEAAKKEQLLQKEPMSWRVLPVAHSSQNVLKASHVVPDYQQKAEDRSSAVENPTSEQTPLSTTESMGDPTQDMLNLFLGSLLKKPVHDQKNTNACGNNLDSAFQSVSHRQNNVGEDIVAPVKKRVALRTRSLH